jgi:hypothetical protein
MDDLINLGKLVAEVIFDNPDTPGPLTEEQLDVVLNQARDSYRAIGKATF